jgi:outer membrane lipoprotein carrier protein
VILKISSTKVIKILLLLNIILFLPFNAGLFANEQLTKVLEGILGRYADLPGFSVNYQREIITKSMAMLGDEMKSDIATGSFLFKPPNCLKVAQDTPAKEIVTYDGQTIWWYIPEKKNVYKYSADELGKELRLLSDIFRGLSNIADSFQVSLKESVKDEGYHLLLIPRDPWEEIDHIELSVSRDDFHIQVMEIHNFLGSVTRFNLGDISVRDSFAKDFFSFVPPDGVEVIEEQ